MHDTVRERLSRSCETGLGIVLAAMPVALWVAWTPTVWAIVVAVGFVAAALLIALDHRRGAEGARASPGEAAPALPDTFVATIHEIFPLTYHHSRDGSQRFRSAMEKLRLQLGHRTAQDRDSKRAHGGLSSPFY